MLTRDELVMRLEAKHPSWYHRDIRDALDALITHIAGSLALGQRVELRDFGTFFVRPPRAHARVLSVLCPVRWDAPKKRAAFKAFAAMRRRLNPGATGSAYAFQVVKARTPVREPLPNGKRRPGRPRVHWPD